MSTTTALEGGATLGVTTTFNPIIDGMVHTLRVPFNIPPASHYEAFFGITEPIELLSPPSMQGSFEAEGTAVFANSSGACG